MQAPILIAEAYVGIARDLQQSLTMRDHLCEIISPIEDPLSLPSLPDCDSLLIIMCSPNQSITCSPQAWLERELIVPIALTHRWLQESSTPHQLDFLAFTAEISPSSHWQVACAALQGFARNLRRELLGKVPVRFHELHATSMEELEEIARAVRP